MFSRRPFILAFFGLVLAVPRGASAERGLSYIGITYASVAGILCISSIVTISGNSVTYPSADEPVSPSARGWAIADIVVGSLDVVLAVTTIVGIGHNPDTWFTVGVGIPVLGVGATAIGLGVSALRRLPDESAGLQILPLPFVQSGPDGEVFGGVSFVGVGW